MPAAIWPKLREREPAERDPSGETGRRRKTVPAPVACTGTRLRRVSDCRHDLRMKPIRSSMPSDTSSKPRPAWPRLVAAFVVGGLVAVPASYLLLRRPSPAREAAPVTMPASGSAPAPAPAPLSLPEEVAELYEHTLKVLNAAAAGAPDAEVVMHLNEVAGALPPAQAAFEALSEADREPVTRAAQKDYAALVAAAGRVAGRPDVSRELKSLTRETVVQLGTFAIGGYRVEEALEAAYLQSMVVLEKFQAGALTPAEAAADLDRLASRVGTFLPAFDALEEPYRSRIQEEARRLMEEFPAVAIAAESGTDWTPELQQHTTELLQMLTGFAR